MGLFKNNKKVSGVIICLSAPEVLKLFENTQNWCLVGLLQTRTWVSMGSVVFVE